MSMIRISKALSLTTDFDFGIIGTSAEDVLFFDIETTGLSAYKSNLYLIGYLTFERGEWTLTQLFAESMEDEVPMLKAFCETLQHKKRLISFNGEGFDIPFLTTMIRQYGLSLSLDGIESLDIFKQLRPAKGLLSLPNYKLKTCEKFLGIDREDIYSGGELIYVYFEYLKTRDPEKLKLLLLHNAEDLANLPAVLSILNYSYLASSPSYIKHQETVHLDSSQLGPGGETVLSLVYSMDLSVPKSVSYERERFTLNVTGNEVNLCVTLFDGELKLFYPDYKNYYYLPMEDQAIHKSVGEFVDPKFRKRATAKTCYTRRSGLFLPELSPVFAPVFYKDYKGKVLYAEYAPALFNDQIKAQAYLRSFFGLISGKKPLR